jgi:hypothetical protein
MLLRRALLYGNKIDPLYKRVLEYAGDYSIPLPDATLQAKQNAYAVGCRAAGLLERWRVKYVTACHDRDFGKINWMDPGTYNCTENGTLVFTANVGFRSDGTTGYLDTNWRPILDGGSLYTLNDGSVAWYVQNNRGVTEIDFGVRLNTTTNRLFGVSRNASDTKVGVINQGNTNTTTTSTNSIGRHLLERTASNATRLSKDGVSETTGSGVSTSLFTGTMFICAVREAGSATFFSEKNISDLSAGASLGSLAVDDSNLWYDYFNSL